MASIVSLTPRCPSLCCSNHRLKFFKSNTKHTTHYLPRKIKPMSNKRLVNILNHECLGVVYPKPFIKQALCHTLILKMKGCLLSTSTVYIFLKIHHIFSWLAGVQNHWRPSIRSSFQRVGLNRNSISIKLFKEILTIFIAVTWVNPNITKVEGAADPRRILSGNHPVQCKISKLFEC